MCEQSIGQTFHKANLCVYLFLKDKNIPKMETMNKKLKSEAKYSMAVFLSRATCIMFFSVCSPQTINIHFLFTYLIILAETYFYLRRYENALYSISNFNNA